ncbi:polysaccharide biosynthesis tyrosine autokinase [Chitinophagaceae bacterium LB-8]|uniref:non-specific protein-tyrosine kinase n=1 Tax=Paraflavisolibacter caeni TaxID=2982496 RepID=A0A9X2XSH0_9BACT|nr:polysaccharide biosynthesis tyrosine autokinase [Paraflavisolibacter caeni]MCU7547497.1 polysaccharide biosynthesis tyrosine autokinase [Paraflavisolibacter caeni]
MQESTKRYEHDQSDDNFFRETVVKFLTYWPVFLILIIMSLGGAWLYLRNKVSVYAITASILIKDEKKGLGDSKALEALDMFGSKKIVENEIKVLQSKTLAQEVVKNLHLYSPVTSEGKFSDRSAYITSPIQVVVQNPDSLKPFQKVYFAFYPQSQEVKINGKAYAIGKWQETPFGIIKFILNKNYHPSAQKLRLYFTLIQVRKAAREITGRIKVTPSSKQSTFVELGIEDEVSQRGEDILNELIAVYNRAAIMDKSSLEANTLQFVEDRLKYVVNELDSVEGQLQSYKAQNNITNISEQGEVFLQTVSANDQKINDISMKLAVLDQVENYVRGKEEKGNIVPSTLGISDPVLTQLLEKLYSLEVEYEQTKKVVPENNPTVVAMVDGIKKIKPGILENITNQRISLKAARAELITHNNHYFSLLQAIPKKERELLSISRQQSIKNNIYTYLLQKREEAALSYASTVADSRVIDRAESSELPVSPKKTTVYLISVIMAFGIGVGFITFKELLNHTVVSHTEIERYTSIPILGEIVFAQAKSPIVIAEGKRTLVAEHFRYLRTSLGFLGINSRKKKILVTSNISGEGKSFITANLGISLSLIGKKVCLIELDLHKPALSNKFGVSNDVGITNYLLGQNNAEKIIQRTETNNLYLIPSGPLPANPSELILNGRLQELFAYLEAAFDYILIDTVPINPVTDAHILSPLCDATLFIVRYGYTPKVFIQRLEEQNRIKSLKNIAIVFNGIRQKGFGKYGYSHSYSFGYEYVEEGKSSGQFRRRIRSYLNV